MILNKFLNFWKNWKKNPKNIFVTSLLLIIIIYIIIFIMYQIAERCAGIDSGNDGYQAYQHAHEKKPSVDVIVFCQPSRFLPLCKDFNSHSRLMFCKPVISSAKSNLAVIVDTVPEKAQYFYEPSYSANYADDKILVGASHNIFIARILNQIGNKEKNVGPETQFEAEIIFNIKGNLSKKVIINQQGGMKEGLLYGVGERNTIYPGDDPNYLLQPGSTYILATRYNHQEDWYTLNSHPYARKLLDKDYSKNLSQLFFIAENDERSISLHEAYRNETLLYTDVINGNTRNSYRSLYSETY